MDNNNGSDKPSPDDMKGGNVKPKSSTDSKSGVNAGGAEGNDKLHSAKVKRKKDAKKIVNEILQKRKNSAGSEDSDALGAGVSGDDALILQKENKILKSKQDVQLRRIAELENIVRRKDIDIKNAKTEANKKFAEAMSEIPENLMRAISSIPEKVDPAMNVSEFVNNMKIGLNMALRSTEDILKSNGLERVAPERGDVFDPNFHQAVSVVEDKDLESGLVVNVVRAGCKFGGILLKSAMVVTSK